MASCWKTKISIDLFPYRMISVLNPRRLLRDQREITLLVMVIILG